MLESLSIENIAVIERATAEFDCGFNVMTGETGAGKSLLMDALNAVLGNRAARDLIRAGADEARVSAVFFAPDAAELLAEMALRAEEDGTLILTRVLSRDGRNRCTVNGSAVTLTQLREIGHRLVTIHGQQDNQALLCSGTHIDFLDEYAQCGAQLADYRTALHHAANCRAALDAAIAEASERDTRMAELEEAIEELDRAKLTDGEEETLTLRRDRLANAEALLEQATLAYEALCGDMGGKTALYTAAHAVAELGTLDASFAELGERLQSIYYELDEAGHDLARFQSSLSFEPAELDALESRLDLYHRLRRKYGCDTEQLLRLADELRAQRDALEDSEAHRAHLQAEADRAQTEAEARAKELSALRKRAAEALCSAVAAELEALDMPRVTFTVSVTPCALWEKGGESIEFLIATNPSEPPKPLTKIASGGEMSRIMLAMKSVFTEIDRIPTLVFDEIDTGVSGRAAQRIAEKLRLLSQGRQVLCITHLPLLAAAAERHFLIQKDTQGASFSTTVAPLDQDGRISELCRLIGGDAVTAATRQSAAELLDAWKQHKKEG